MLCKGGCLNELAAALRTVPIRKTVADKDISIPRMPDYALSCKSGTFQQWQINGKPAIKKKIRKSTIDDDFIEKVAN